MSPVVEIFIVLAILALLFITEIVPMAVTAIGGAIVCGFLGIIPVEQVFRGFSNPTIVFLAGMYVIGASLLYTGLAQGIGSMILKVCGKNENGIMLSLMVVATLLSAVLSNTGTAACLLPIALGICAAGNLSTYKYLMPLAFACSWGGLITLVGAPPNIIANIALGSVGLSKFSFFEFAWIGIPLSIFGMIYMMTIGKKLLLQENRSNKMELFSQIKEEISEKKQVISGVVLLGIIIIMALDIRIISLEVASVIGAIICVITKCLSEKEAYLSIDWTAIFLFAGMVPIAEAMGSSGANEVIAAWGVDFLGDTPSPYSVLAMLFFISCGLTQFIPNTASAILLCPMGISMAQALGVNPNAAVMAIIVASSCAYATPLGTPTNMLVLGYGGYSFRDYLRVGTGLLILSFLVSMIIIPIVWPFF